MFNRLNQTILNAIHSSFEKSSCDFSKWWKDYFETDYWFDTEDELKFFPEGDLECVKCDWVAWAADGFTYMTLGALGIDNEVSTEYNTILIEEIYDIVKEELLKKLEAEWK